MITTNTTLTDDEIVNIAADWGINIIGVIGDYPNEEYKCIKFARAIEQMVAQSYEKRISELETVIVEMVRDGWLSFGVEGMSDAQAKCYAEFLKIRALANADPVHPDQKDDK